MANRLKLLGLRGLSFLPSLIVHALIIFFYGIYMDTYLVPLIQENNSFPKGWDSYKDLSSINWLNRATIYFFITHVLSIMFFASYIKVVFTSPGSIPTNWNKEKMDEAIVEYIRTKKENNSGLFANLLTKEMMANINVNDKDFKDFLENTGRRFCEICKTLKPERTHHCRQCGFCVLKMDHHCNWLYNCIGFNNYKSFLVFLFYTNSLLIFFFITYTECVSHFYMDNTVSDIKFFIISLAFFLNASFIVILVSFTAFHLFYLAPENKTTLEFCESSDSTNDFNNGFWNNWFSICGKNPILWFSPFCALTEGEGVKFPQKNDSDDEMFNLIRK